MPDTIFEESEEDSGVGSEDKEARNSTDSTIPDVKSTETPVDIAKRDEAAAELRQHENVALLSCFIGPLLGAYLLHAIRGQLTRPSEGLVSNFNLTIFVLAAELRPCSHLITLIQARTLHLQRIVEANTNDIDRIQDDKISDLTKRLEEMETRAATVADSEPDARTSREASINEINQALRHSVQPQVDALNRAVRRYEKRATTQTIQTEARLQDLEARLRDALSLAAVAANQSQKPGIIMATLEWISHLFALPFQAIWSLFIWPWEATANALAVGKTWILGGRSKRKPKRTSKEKDPGYRIVEAPRPLSTKSSRR